MKKQDYLSIVGNNIQTRRKGMGMSQQELADAVNLPKASIHQIEEAIVPASVLTLKNISIALKINLLELLRFNSVLIII